RLGCEAPVILGLEGDLRPGTYMAQGQQSAVLHIAQVFEDNGGKYLAMIMPPGQVPARLGVGPCPESVLSSVREVRIARRGCDSIVPFDMYYVPYYRPDGGAKPYLFPIIRPSRVRYTRTYPMEEVSGAARDHPRQRSFLFTHAKVKGTDFWSEETG